MVQTAQARGSFTRYTGKLSAAAVSILGKQVLVVFFSIIAIWIRFKVGKSSVHIPVGILWGGQPAMRELVKGDAEVP